MKSQVVVLAVLLTILFALPLRADCEGFFEQPGAREAGVDCSQRPPGSVCLAFSDGFIWLIYDSIAPGAYYASCGDEKVRAVPGFKGEYRHILGTNRVKFVPFELGATVAGLSPTRFTCWNETTGQRVAADTRDVSSSCREIGLSALPGDVVIIGYGGLVKPQASPSGQ